MAEGKLFDLTITGDKELVANIEAIVKAVEAEVPKILTDAAEIPMGMMRRLVPVNTGKLRASIRFALGNQGQARTGIRTSTGKIGKTRFVGFIMAGDQTTLVGGSKGASKRKKVGRQWQNARLQEFGTQKMPAKPYFFPAWRATRQRTKQLIQVRLAGVIRRAKRRTPVKEAA